MELTQGYIDSLAPKGSAISNGKALIGKFLTLNISGDDTLIFGQCAGSGKNPYSCSVDFIDRDNPVARCSCPSRQIPCKHALGLMYALSAGKAFTAAEIPEDILSKREKLEKRAENKEKKAEETRSRERKPPTKARLTSGRKRIGTQLEGVENAELLTRNILQAGISGIDAAALKNLEQQAKNLGNYHIGGIQTAFNNVLLALSQQGEEGYDRAIEALLYMNALLDKARSVLTARRDGDDEAVFKLDTSSAIDEQIGHVWTIESLRENGMVMENARLLQLAFYSYDDPTRREFVDQGFYFCLNDGRVYTTYNYRPYKAVKYVKEDDSRFELVEAPELCVYPGNANPRVRYERHSMSPVTPEHLSAVKAAAKDSYPEVVKAVKNQIMSPLADKNPLYLLKISDVACTEDEKSHVRFHIADRNGVKQVLLDKGYIETETVAFLSRFDPSLLIGNALLVMFANDPEAGVLSAKPLALVTDSEIVRFVY